MSRRSLDGLTNRTQERLGSRVCLQSSLFSPACLSRSVNLRDYASMKLPVSPNHIANALKSEGNSLARIPGEGFQREPFNSAISRVGWV